MEIKCDAKFNIKHIILVKPGMAKKAMIKNMTEPGRFDRLEKQIKKGTVIIITKP